MMMVINVYRWILYETIPSGADRARYLTLLDDGVHDDEGDYNENGDDDVIDADHTGCIDSDVDDDANDDVHI